MDLKSAANMAEFNRMNNIKKNSQAVIKRAAKALAGYKSGDRVTTKELKMLGYIPTTASLIAHPIKG